MFRILVRQFKNPLLLIFLISTVVAFLIGQRFEAIVIWFIMLVSVALGFWNEYRAEKVVHDLLKKISFTTLVLRNGIKRTIPVSEVLIGDKVFLYPGSIIPADIKLAELEHMEVNESVLTGESVPVEKKDGDIIYMGTVVTGGVASGLVVAIGADTKFGQISKEASKIRPETEFQKGLREFGLLLTKIAGVAVFAIIIVNWLLGRPMVETTLFALTVAMGITPELLPLIVTIGLSYGAKKLAKENMIVKEFVSIEDLGNIEVLCTDKTGTLTEGKISLKSFENKEGKEDKSVLNLGLLCNSIFVHRHVFGDSVDRSIWDFAESRGYKIDGKYKKIDSIPFDFENRFMSIVVEKDGDKLLICKGSPEAIFERCDFTPSERRQFESKVKKMQSLGLRVIAVATKRVANLKEKLNIHDIKGLKFEGILALSDIPKKDLASIFEKFIELGVNVKIVTGDNEEVTKKVAKEVGFKFQNILTGPEIEKIDDGELSKIAWKTDIFARVTPSQKTRIIQALKVGGHTVGFLGDGINDAPALRTADVGISVNTGVDVAKDAASVVLLTKSLGAIADGVRQGRITFQNTIKYILMGTSSDFGNMISAALASLFLPFLPMAPVQVLTTDILYDTSQVSIPTDNVDNDQIRRPKSWNINYIKKFMYVFGPISTAYDFITFGIMYFMFHARGPSFQTGWFIESLITEVMVVFVIRTRRIPFWRSVPSLPLFATCIGVVMIGIYLPFSRFAEFLNFKPLPISFFAILVLLTVTYLILVEAGKHFLNREIVLDRDIITNHEISSSES